MFGVAGSLWNPVYGPTGFEPAAESSTSTTRLGGYIITS